MDLQRKVALITGGARMGETIARALGQRGCQIVLTWRSSRAKVQKTVDVLEAEGIDAFALPCDVSKPASIQTLVGSIRRQFKRLDVLISMASNYETTPLTSKNPAKDWDDHLTVDARSSYLMGVAAAPLMKQGKGGRIILFSDWLPASGRPRYPNHAGYYVAKAAVKAVTEDLALELAPDVLVNAIAPGPTLPPASMSPKEVQAVIKATPLGRWGGADEIAKAVLFLIDTDFTTGETVRVDGGRHLL
jgi:NAD(P)-dependent dehydrogenase (short-subunit alcohol dehydrogenase family)